MFNKNNKENEVITMEQTTFIQRHAKKILLAGGLIVAAGTGYLLYKHGLEIHVFKEKIALDGKTIDRLTNELDQVSEDNHTLMTAASEGLFEEAISKVTNKINYRIDRKEALEKALEKYPDDMQTKDAFKKVIDELEVLLLRRDKFIKAQALVEIKDID